MQGNDWGPLHTALIQAGPAGLLAQRQEASFKETAAAKALEASTSAGMLSHGLLGS